MNVNDKVTYNSMTGPVTAVVVEVYSVRDWRAPTSTDRLTLRSTSRTNRTYPAGFEWTVPLLASSVVPRP